MNPLEIRYISHKTLTHRPGGKDWHSLTASAALHRETMPGLWKAEISGSPSANSYGGKNEKWDQNDYDDGITMGE